MIPTNQNTVSLWIRTNVSAPPCCYFSPGLSWLDTVRIRARDHPDVLPLRAGVLANINLDIKMAVLHVAPYQGYVQLPGFSLLNKELDQYNVER